MVAILLFLILLVLCVISEFLYKILCKLDILEDIFEEINGEEIH